MGKKIDYSRKLNPVYIEAIEANHIYINDYAEKTNNRVEYKIGAKWFEFNKIRTRKAVLTDSLFLRFINSSITRYSGDSCRDFIVVKFNYNAEYRTDAIEIVVDKHDLRKLYYVNGVSYTFEKKNKQGDIVEKCPIHYKMLMRSPGKAKNGECVFIKDSLYHKAINFLTMGLYDKMDEQSKNNPEKVFKLVELSAYLTLTTATAIDYIQIPLDNILIVKDEEVYSDGMKAAIVGLEDKKYGRDEFVLDFESPRLEALINKKGFTFNEEKAKEKNLTLIVEKTKTALKENNIHINGKYPGEHRVIEYTRKECTVKRVSDAKIKNILWDGGGLIDEKFFPKNMNGFIYCRSHFFKSCLFRGNIQEFFKDYCNEHGLDYENYTVEKTDMFSRNIKLSDIKVIVTDKSLKWLKKFVDMMGGSEQRAYSYYYNYMKRFDNYFSIVKTAHSSKWNKLQLMAYQMNNSLPTTSKFVLSHVANCGIDLCNNLKVSDEAYLNYLDMKKDNFNINELLIELIRWNRDFLKTDFFRKRKSRDISALKEQFQQGRLPQIGDNLTIMDNPVALLMKAVGENPLEENCFELMKDGVQCYTPRFAEGERLAAFRSPHNSPNNIIYLYNVYPEKILRYFPNIGQNVIIFNAIKTDTQARLSGHDVDSDFVYVTNQNDLAELARTAYIEYPTIINDIKEDGENSYRFTLENYAEMDNKIADAQESIGTSTDIAQLALSYYYDGGMTCKELEDCFMILSVIGQISIDLAKKSFAIDVVKEISRIRRLPCMRRNEIPRFFANTKKSRNNKVFENKKIKTMNCPQDIMADIIEKKVIKYAHGREKHIPLRNFWDYAIIGKGNRYKKEKVIIEANEYNKTVKWLESTKDQMSDNTYWALKNRAMTQFINRASKDLDQETVMQLVIYATNDDNSDICATVLNFLFREHKEEFMNCFIKNGQNKGEIFTQNA